MAAAGEGELYVQYSIPHWVLMRLHMSLKKDIGKRITGIFAMDKTLDLTKEKCVNHNLITKIRGKRGKRGKAHLWIWTSLDYNQMFPLDFGVTAPRGSSSIS